jgi:hypothetical protein
MANYNAHTQNEEYVGKSYGDAPHSAVSPVEGALNRNSNALVALTDAVVTLEEKLRGVISELLETPKETSDKEPPSSNSTLVITLTNFSKDIESIHRRVNRMLDRVEL